MALALKTKKFRLARYNTEMALNLLNDNVHNEAGGRAAIQIKNEKRIGARVSQRPSGWG